MVDRRSFFLLVTCLHGAVLVLPAWSTTAPPPRPRAEVEDVLAKAPPAPAGKLRPLHIVLLADKKDHGPGQHDYPCWQERWAVLLGGKRAGGSNATQVNLHGPATGGDAALAGAPEVKVSTAWQWPSDEQFASAQLIAMFCYRSGGPHKTWSAEQVRQLRAYLERGGGFVAIHPATYTLRDLSKPSEAEVIRLTGLAYDRTLRYRHGPVEMKIAAPDHPICTALPRVIRLHDEPYWPPRGSLAGLTVPATTDETVTKGTREIASQPLFSTNRVGKGRVFACVPGHFNWTFDDPYFRILLLRGMAWAADESPYRFDALVLRGAAVSQPK